MERRRFMRWLSAGAMGGQEVRQATATSAMYRFAWVQFNPKTEVRSANG